MTKLSSKVYKQYLLSNGRIHTFLPNNFTTKKRTVIFSRELPYWYSLSLTDTENCYWGKLLLSLWLRWSQTRQFLWLQTKTKNKVTTTTINVYRLPIMQQSNRTPRRTEKYPHSVHVASARLTVQRVTLKIITCTYIITYITRDRLLSMSMRATVCHYKY